MFVVGHRNGKPKLKTQQRLFLIFNKWEHQQRRSLVLSKSTSTIRFPKPTKENPPKYEAGWLINLKGKKNENGL